ncbi:Fe3+-hydroxamate ABC transporter permease FhuB [Embleya scabrispora]|uniref:Fe3+-hydroxamate ABC transporter permease FhuB n=1 Tax=Embleya scabrispora TaxID=159449 RepID=A0A1T3P4A1_9ACTN|nr:Fe(3+)-hydroxamate ABC transporter permease FhuB [Embleya scabrispora]OPC83928.1 Fe3+-hydroxamate ABC transporter permease FhuB [Embleya scabrispora]
MTVHQPILQNLGGPPSLSTDATPGAHSDDRRDDPSGRAAGRRTVLIAAIALTATVVVLTGISLSVGAGEVGVGGAFDYIFNRHGARSDSHLTLVIRDLRLPRTLTALLTGAALGTAGCLLQTVTRNPLAETGLLGVNAGASLGVVLGITLVGVQTGYGYLVWAFAGAAVAGLLVLAISARRGGGSPMRLVLAGAALSATFGGITNILIVNSTEAYDNFRFWILGSLAGIQGFDSLGSLAPVLAGGFVLAVLVSRSLSALVLGDDLARGLGHRPALTRALVAVSVTLLTASSVALVGPISFLGLLAGFLARTLAGPRILAQLCFSALIGAAVLTAADVAARVVARPFEAPVSVIVALIGAPLLIGVVRSRRLGALGLTDAPEPTSASGGGVGGAARVRRLLGIGRGGAGGGAGVARAGADARAGEDAPECEAARADEAARSAALVRRVRRLPEHLVVRRGRFSLLLPGRAVLATTLLAVALAAAIVVSVYSGQRELGLVRTFDAILGRGDHFDVLLVREFRLGRIVAGAAAGAALGVAGCLTQTLARNRLATPELLGVNDGATAAVLISVSFSASGSFGAWWAGPIGALVAAVVVTAVAGGLGQRGYRVLVVGLALSALASAITQVVLARRSLNSASALYVWSSGSLNGRGYSVAWPVLIGLAVLVPLALALGRKLDVLRFDDSTASSLGLDPGRIRLVCLVAAVCLAGLAVGICGPVGFVALAAPVIAGRLTGPLRVPVLGSMLVGAILIVLADMLGRIVLDGAEIPVGVVTTVLGGPFLLWVLLGRSASARA